jgi:cyclophilin family peptidyl-prolyl cis-trans isomerase/HEAT repeat protein
MAKPIHRSLFPGVRPALLLLPILVATGCGEAEIPESAGIPVEAPGLRPYDGLLESPELQAVVELAVARNREGLIGLLAHDDPRVRARAAFSLASIPDLDPEPLIPLMADPEGAVRADAAFALGRARTSDGGASLVDALQTEGEPVVRRRILEALGYVGDEAAVGRLLAMGPGEDEVPWIRALVRGGLREVRPEGLVEAFLDRLDHADPGVREEAAHYFARVTDEDHWRERADRLRQVLDGYQPDDPAAMHLVVGLARGRDQQDLERLLEWMEEAEDWRTRANVARSMGATYWLDSPGVRAALFRALDDPSEQVGIAAARSLTRGFWVPPNVQELMERRLDGPSDRWRTQAPFLMELAHHRSPEPVVAWTRRMFRVNPRAAAYGVRALVEIPGEDVSAVIREAAEARDPLIRGMGFAALGDRWLREARTEEEFLAFYRLFLGELRDGEAPAAAYAARSLGHPGFLQQGSWEALEEAFRRRSAVGDVQIATVILEVLGQIGDPESMAVVADAVESHDPRIRREAFRVLEEHPTARVPDEAPPLARPELELDFALLASLGPEPRLQVRTEKGTLVIRMVTDQAPLTVQTLARQALEGLHDGVLIHRLEPNFVFQAGDFSMGDGTGGPGYTIRTELTWIPFGRGVAGMASAGRDTEGSHWFVTHSLQHHLDGEFTAFGWVESGRGVLDHLLEGDRILEMTVEPGPGG